MNIDRGLYVEQLLGELAREYPGWTSLPRLGRRLGWDFWSAAQGELSVPGEPTREEILARFTSRAFGTLHEVLHRDPNVRGRVAQLAFDVAASTLHVPSAQLTPAGLLPVDSPVVVRARRAAATRTSQVRLAA